MQEAHPPQATQLCGSRSQQLSAVERAGEKCTRNVHNEERRVSSTSFYLYGALEHSMWTIQSRPYMEQCTTRRSATAEPLLRSSRQLKTTRPRVAARRTLSSRRSAPYPALHSSTACSTRR